jgi:hypothetical protein
VVCQPNKFQDCLRTARKVAAKSLTGNQLPMHRGLQVPEILYNIFGEEDVEDHPATLAGLAWTCRLFIGESDQPLEAHFS